VAERSAVLVLDGEERSALAVARSLVRAGFEVWVGRRRRGAIAAYTRGARALTLASTALEDPAAFAADVAAHVRRINASLLIPLTDASVQAILEHRDTLPVTCRLPFGSLDSFRRCSDKQQVHELAESLGVGAPDSVCLRDRFAAVPDAPSHYPAVVKPHRSVGGDLTRMKLLVRVVNDAEECRRALNDLPAEAFPVLVQRRIIGPGEGVFLARWHGRTLARFAHRRLREKPPAGGVSVVRESIAMDPAVLDACEKLLDRLDWQGVAMIEGKRDLSTGRWCVIEVNGRFWGSLQLAIDAGVDFPSIVARAVLDGPPEPIPRWRSGVRLRWEWGDMDHLLIRMVRSRARLHLPPNAPGRLGVIAGFFAHIPGRDRVEVFRWSDPMPFVIESLDRLGIVR
jgi:predicted ATP-grasp superfamily ATP-dependent carboligase